MPRDFTTALGRLLSEAALRADFRRDPSGTAALLDLDPDDRAALAGLPPEELDLQAEGLIEKRLHEAVGLLPRTFAALGCGGDRLFRRYAGTTWPGGHRRHLADAVGFGLSLLDTGVKGLCRWELNRLRFELGRSRFALRLVTDSPEGAALQLLWRSSRGGVRSAAIGLRLPRPGRRRSTSG